MNTPAFGYAFLAQLTGVLRTRHWLTIGLLLAACSSLAQEPKHLFDIRHGKATDSLHEVARLSEIDILYNPKLVEKVKTPPLLGWYTPRQALERLLAHTSLVVIQDPETASFAIRRKPTSPTPQDDSSNLALLTQNNEITDSEMNTPVEKDTTTIEERSPQPAPRKGFFARVLSTLTAATVISTTPVAQAQDEDDEVYDLSLFTIDASEDSGYLANSTLAGTRIKSDLQDIGTSIQVVTAEFLEDTGATNVNELLIYTTNTETGGSIGNFSGVAVASGRTDTQSAREAPQNAQRIRGLFTADLTRNYFLTTIPFDEYNTSRVEINRGSNAILFGLGSPAGIINNGLSRAQMDDFGSVKVRIGEKGSFRLSFDVNKELVEGKVALRAAALFDNRKYIQEPAFEDVNRYYLTTTIRPFENTTIRVHYEKGDIKANRPDVIAPKENISGWLLSGSPLFDARIGTMDPTGIFLDIDGDGEVEEVPASLIDSGNVRVSTVGPNGRPLNEGQFFINPNNGLLDGPNFPVPPGADRPPNITSARFWHQVGLVWDDPLSEAPSFGLFGQYPPNNRAIGDALDMDGNIDNLRFVSARNLDAMFNNYARQGFTSIDEFDFGKNLMVGSASFQNEDFDNTNIVLEQNFFDNKLGFELAFDRQFHDRESYAPFQDNAGSIYVDMNIVLPDGSPNPNVGRPFVDGRRSKNDFTIERETRRFTAYYDLNFEDIAEDGWARWLGRHLFTGFYNKREDEQLTQSSRMAVKDDQILRALRSHKDVTTFRAMLNPLMYVGDSLVGITSMENLPLYRLENTRTWMPGETAEVTFWDPGVQPGTENNPATDKDVIRAQGTLVTRDIPITEAILNATLEERVVDSVAAIAQSYWLKNHLVTTVGWREDEVELRRIAGAPRDEYNSTIPSRIREGTPSVTTLKDDRWSYGAVAYWPTGWIPLPGDAKLSVHYSESSNFQPQAGRVDFRNRPISSPSGETEERGFTISTADNKFSARFNWFDTVLANRSSSTQLFGEIVTNAIWQSADFNFASSAQVTDPELARFTRAVGQALLDGVLPGENDRQRPEILRDNDGNPIGVNNTNAVAGASDTEDVAAEGMEVELIYNPLPNWRLALNVAKQETTRSNVLPISENELIPARLALYEQPVPGFEWITIGESPRGTVTDSSVNFDPANQVFEFINPGPTSTLRGWLEQGQGQGNLIGFRTAKAAEGAIATEQRMWRVNMVTHYDFTEGALADFGVGGAVRWQDKAAIGFPFITNEDGQRVGDVTNPYFDDDQMNFDFWVRWNVPFFQDSFDWTIQLNARNIFTSSDEIIPIQAQPDGRFARVRFAPQRSWFITSSFEF